MIDLGVTKVSNENILGDRIKKLREKRSISQKRAAAIFGITNFQLSRYELGKANPDPDLIAKFADYYEVTADYLLGRTDNPKLSEKDILKTLINTETVKEDSIEDIDLEKILSNVYNTKIKWGDEELKGEDRRRAIQVLKALFDVKKDT